MNAIKIIPNGNKITADILNKIYANTIPGNNVKSLYMFVDSDNAKESITQYILDGKNIVKKIIKLNGMEMPISDKQIGQLIGKLTSEDWEVVFGF